MNQVYAPPPPFPPQPAYPPFKPRSNILGILVVTVLLAGGILLTLWANGVFGSGGRTAPRDDTEIVHQLPGRYAIDCGNPASIVSFARGGLVTTGLTGGQWMVHNGSVTIQMFDGTTATMKIKALGADGFDAVLPNGRSQSFQRCSN